VLKVDDDVLVNSYSLLSHLDNLKLKTTNNILCYVHLNAPIERDLNSKFYVSSNEKKEQFFPKYCDGPAYMFQGNLAIKLYEASLHTKYFKFEDVYFGLLAAKLNLNFIDLRARYANEKQINGLLESKRIIATFFIYSFKKPELFRNLWFKLVDIHGDSEDLLFNLFSVLFLIYFKLKNLYDNFNE